MRKIYPKDTKKGQKGEEKKKIFFNDEEEED